MFQIPVFCCQKRSSPPYRTILTSVPVWGFVTVMTSNLFLINILSAYLPLYLTTVFGLSIEEVRRNIFGHSIQVTCNLLGHSFSVSCSILGHSIGVSCNTFELSTEVRYDIFGLSIEGACGILGFCLEVSCGAF